MKDLAQDVAEDVLGAAKDGNVKFRAVKNKQLCGLDSKKTRF